MRASKIAKRRFSDRMNRWTVAAALALIAGSAAVSRAAEPGNGDVEVIKLRPSFYVIVGAGANISVQIGVDGVVLVDAGTEAASDRVVAAIRKLTDLPIRYIIDSGADADRVGGNGKVANAGITIFTSALGNANFGNAMTNGGAAAILAHNSILRRMSAPTGKASAFPVDSWPTESYLRNRWYIRMNDEPIEILYQPAAHSDADSFVFFRKSDVVAAGDILDTTRFPVIDIANGGSVQGEIDALNRLIEIAVPPGLLFTRE